MLATGLWWLHRATTAARRHGEGSDRDRQDVADGAADDSLVRERAVVAHEFDPAEIHHAEEVPHPPGILRAALPLLVVVLVNL